MAGAQLRSAAGADHEAVGIELRTVATISKSPSPLDLFHSKDAKRALVIASAAESLVSMASLNPMPLFSSPNRPCTASRIHLAGLEDKAIAKNDYVGVRGKAHLRSRRPVGVELHT